jgi:translin
MDEIFKYKAKYPEIYFPITHDAMQEFVEGYAFLHVIRTGNIDIDFSTLKVEIPAILTGLADLVGELRRYILDLLRKGEFEKSEHLMNIMEMIYSNLLTFNFPDKLTPNLRPKVDAARWTIERTKSDFIAAKVASIGDILGVR